MEKKIEYEPVPSNERCRDYDVPSGLKNVGNSKCYLLNLLIKNYSLLFWVSDAGVIPPAKYYREADEF